MPQSEIVVSLITLSGILALAWMTPGPNMLAVIESALKGGWMVGFTIGLGISTENIIWSIIALIGSEAIFDRFAQSILFIPLLGCIYLLYLGERSLKTALSPMSDDYFYDHDSHLFELNSGTLRDRLRTFATKAKE